MGLVGLDQLFSTELVFVIDVISLIAVFYEGFSDLYFVVLQVPITVLIAFSTVLTMVGSIWCLDLHSTYKCPSLHYSLRGLLVAEQPRVASHWPLRYFLRLYSCFLLDILRTLWL
eukprot:SAG31_NODE_806_length_11957_cov_2.232670_9_plen_115_part_00